MLAIPEKPKTGKAKKPEPEIILIRETETLWKSILSDAVSFAAVVGIIGIGALLQSGAMQWAGFIMLVLAVTGRIIGKTKRLTIAEARARLDEIERGQS